MVLDPLSWAKNKGANAFEVMVSSRNEQLRSKYGTLPLSLSKGWLLKRYTQQCNKIYSIVLMAPCSHRSSRCFLAHVGSEFSTSQPYWQALSALPMPLKKKKRHSGLFIRGLGREKTAGGCFCCASTPSLRGRTHYKDNTPHTCSLTWSAIESRARSRWIIPGSTSIMKTVFSMNHLSGDFGMSHTTTDTLKQVFFNR